MFFVYVPFSAGKTKTKPPFLFSFFFFFRGFLDVQGFVGDAFYVPSCLGCKGWVAVPFIDLYGGHVKKNQTEVVW